MSPSRASSFPVRPPVRDALLEVSKPTDSRPLDRATDVFYTNSRYAKVGGLPQSELNQLELQFLLLNDFNLTIPLEEMQRYGDQLLLYSRNAAAVAAEVRRHRRVSPVVTPGADGFYFVSILQ